MTMEKRFASWLDAQIAQGKLPTGEMLVHHKGRLVMQYRNAGLVAPSVSPEGRQNEATIYRLYSMTKPVVSMALMLLFEEGKFQLNEPAWKYLGEKWKKQNMKVMDAEASAKSNSMVTVPCSRSITIHHLLTHTSGLSHGLSIPGVNDPIDAHYRAVGLDSTYTLLRRKERGSLTLQEFCDRLAECPLLFQPGNHWHYSYAVDLIGRIVEVVSGQPLEEFLQQRIFSKLGMTDTSFAVPKEKSHRLCDLWLPPLPGKGGLKSIGKGILASPFQSGSAGLFGTSHDYMLFAEMLLNKGIARSGEHIISAKTLEWMTLNHLRDHQSPARPVKTIREMAFKHLANDQPPGVGFGLGFAVVHDVPFDALIGSVGSYFWAGAASTHFWIDPQEDLAVVFCTQILLADPFEYPTVQTLRSIVYGSLEYETAAPQPSSKYPLTPKL